MRNQVLKLFFDRMARASQIAKRFKNIKKFLPHSTKIVYNCTQKYDFLIRCLHFWLKTKNQSTCKATEVPNANNSNKNRNKTRRDNDITMAGSYNIDRQQNYLHGPIEETVHHIVINRLNLSCASFRKSNQKEAPPSSSYQQRGAIQSTVYDDR